jgi:hypothetical protein
MYVCMYAFIGGLDHMNMCDQHDALSQGLVRSESYVYVCMNVYMYVCRH